MPMQLAPARGFKAWSAAAILAIAIPPLIAYNVAPSATIFNQVAAFFGWGVFLLSLANSLSSRVAPRSAAAKSLLAAVALILVAALVSSLWASTPWPLSLSVAGTLAATLLTVSTAASLARAGLGDMAFKAFCVALVVGGLASSAIGLIQVFLPSLPDGLWIAMGPMIGRAGGNLRQPNHLSSFLLWSSIAVVWLGESGLIARSVAYGFLLLFMFVVFVTGSRTGMVGTGVLAAWGLLDRRLSRSSRAALMLAPLAYLTMWLGESIWSSAGHPGFGAAARPIASDNVTSSRTAIWSNAWTLIRSHPWRGVGFGEFNFAWTLTPFPGRPNEFFDHTHDIVINFAVELGLPLAALVVGLLLFSLYRALLNALADGRETFAVPFRDATSPPMQRAAFAVVAMIGLHSLLEYPLWYAYFLLPTAFAFGLCVERPDANEMALCDDPADQTTRPFVLASMVLVVASTMTIADYRRVAEIFAAPSEPTPLADRIESGQRSILFAHHADYAAATVSEHPSDAIGAFKRASHFLLDARLMIAWARALDESGDIERARYIAQRAREFHNADVDLFFAPCAASPAMPASALPFQCTPPTHSFTFEDFR